MPQNEHRAQRCALMRSRSYAVGLTPHSSPLPFLRDEGGSVSRSFTYSSIKSDSTSLIFLPSLAQAALKELRNSSAIEVLTTTNFCFSLNVKTKYNFQTYCLILPRNIFSYIYYLSILSTIITINTKYDR